MTFPYWNPTRRWIGDGALEKLPEEAALFNPKKILLVLGRASFRNSPHYRKLKEFLKAYKTEETPQVPDNPTVAFADEVMDSLHGKGIDLIVSCGGGSVMDLAKALAIGLTQKNSRLEDLIQNKKEFSAEPLLHIAIPTTAGTGSEVTPYASLETRERKKISLAHPWLFPKVAIVDPLLTHSMPPYLTACTGFDALCQGIESYWSIYHTPFSETHSLRAVGLARENLEKAHREPENHEARLAMALAGTEAGVAISQTKTTACHAVSYPMTTFFKIAHGHACALTLAAFIRYNASSLKDARGQRLWQSLGSSGAEDAARGVERLMDALGLERRLCKLGIDQAGIDLIIENGFRPDRVKNNPREVTREALQDILKKIF